MKPQTNYKKFYEDYGCQWSLSDKKKYIILASKWKTKKIIQIISKSQIAKINSVLEFGCGPAYILKSISKELKIQKSYGIDISHSMLKNAKKNFPKAKYYEMADLSKFNKKMDLILFIDVLEHLPNPKKILNQAIKISKYQFIKVPLENTLIRNFARYIGLNKKSPEGHINFWSKKEFLKNLSKWNLKIMNYYHGNPPKDLQFYNKGYKKEKGLRKFFAYSYDICSKIFFQFQNIYSKLFNSQLFILTKSKNENTN